MVSTPFLTLTKYKFLACTVPDMDNQHNDYIQTIFSIVLSILQNSGLSTLPAAHFNSLVPSSLNSKSDRASGFSLPIRAVVTSLTFSPLQEQRYPVRYNHHL